MCIATHIFHPLSYPSKQAEIAAIFITGGYNWGFPALQNAIIGVFAQNYAIQSRCVKWPQKAAENRQSGGLKIWRIRSRCGCFVWLLWWLYTRSPEHSPSPQSLN
jgi:hypothetical protein